MRSNNNDYRVKLLLIYHRDVAKQSLTPEQYHRLAWEKTKRRSIELLGFDPGRDGSREQREREQRVWRRPR